MATEVVHVLIVETEQEFADWLQSLLVVPSANQFTVIRARQLADGLARLAGGGIDVVLLTCASPDDRDLDSVTAVRQQAPAVPVILLFDGQDDSIGEAAVERGAQDYLIRSDVNARSLAHAIRVTINFQHISEKLRREADTRLAERTAALNRINREHRMIRDCHLAMFQARDEPEFLRDVCRSIVGAQFGREPRVAPWLCTRLSGSIWHCRPGFPWQCSS